MQFEARIGVREKMDQNIIVSTPADSLDRNEGTFFLVSLKTGQQN